MKKMKIKYLLLCFICTSNFYSQTSKVDKTNITIIISKIDEILSEYIFKDENSSYELKEYELEQKFGESVINTDVVRVDTLQFDNFGVIKLNSLKYDFLTHKSGTCNRSNILEYPVKIGKQGEILSAEYLKYKYNANGKIIELKEYSKDGADLEKHYEFRYNPKNQIFEVTAVRNSCTTEYRIIDLYTYDIKGNIIEILRYQKTDIKTFPQRVLSKLKNTYNLENQLESSNLYKNNYGQYYVISGADLTKYVNHKRVAKSFEENKKDLNLAYYNIQSFLYSYESNQPMWNKRIEYNTYNSNNKKDFKAINMIMQTKL